MVPNLVPPDIKPLGGFMYCGTAIPAGHPALLGIWEAALCSLIETYPEADAYGFWMSEVAFPTDDVQTQQLMREYADARKLIPSPKEIFQQGNMHIGDHEWQAKNTQRMESDFAQMCVADKLVRRVKARHPTAKLGVTVLFRGYLLRALDSILPKDVGLQNMENYMNTRSQMQYYDGIEGRELLVMPRMDDDGCSLHMQLSTMLYDRDEIISGGARYGVAGVVGQSCKERGLECNVRYIAEGAWNPKIQSQSFYEGYLGRLFGPDALDTLLKAYRLLEENDKALGWSGHSQLFIGYMRFCPMGLPLRVSAFQEAQPKVDRKGSEEDIKESAERYEGGAQKNMVGLNDRIFYQFRTLSPLLDRKGLEKEINVALHTQQRWTAMAASYRQALDLLRQARPKVLPGAQSELDYVIFKTESFAMYFDVLAAGYEAVASLDQALVGQNSGDTAEVSKQLKQAQAAIDRMDHLAREVARQMIPYANIPTEKYLLFRYNQNVISWTEKAREELAKVLASHKTPGTGSR